MDDDWGTPILGNYQMEVLMGKSTINGITVEFPLPRLMTEGKHNEADVKLFLGLQETRLMTLGFTRAHDLLARFSPRSGAPAVLGVTTFLVFFW